VESLRLEEEEESSLIARTLLIIHLIKNSNPRLSILVVALLEEELPIYHEEDSKY